MSHPLGTEFRLAGPRGDGLHPYINDDGAFIGNGVPLILKLAPKDAPPEWSVRPRPALEKLFSIGYGHSFDFAGRMPGLSLVASALTKGDRSLAAIALVHLCLPPLPSHQAAHKMARADGFKKYNPCWPDQPRAADGKWGPGSSVCEPVGPDPVIPPLVGLPAEKEQYFASDKQRSAWINFNDEVAQLPAGSGIERIIYPWIFAWEGGMTANPVNGAFAGILRSTFDAAQADPKALAMISGLAAVDSVKDLNAEQVAGLYRWYIDDTLQHVGGHKALEQVGDPYAAAAMADTLFNLGAPDGVPMIQEAINSVRKDRALPPISRTIWMNRTTMEAYSALAQDPTTRGALLDKLKFLRNKNSRSDEKRHEFFAFPKARND